MDNALRASLVKEGVRDAVIDILDDEELNEVDILEGTSDELLKSLSIKGGQIVRIRKALAAFLGDQDSASTRQQPSTSAPLQQQPPSRVSPSITTSSSSLPNSTPASPSSPAPSTSSQASGSSCSTPVQSKSAACNSSMTVPSPPTCTQTTRSPSFAIKETGKANNKWLKDFKLPETFSPAVKKGLEEGHLSGNPWNEFNRTICEAIKVHTLYPSPDEKEKVVSMVVKKYPFLGDTLGGGLTTWKKAMTMFFKNKRRKHTKKEGSSAKKRAASPSTGTTATPKFKKRCLGNDLPLYPEGETKETCQEHVKAMKKEMDKTSNRDKAWISELMKLTYAFRRETIIQEPDESTVDKMLSTYPALNLVSELKSEFGRILSEPNAPKDAATNYHELEGKILKVAAQHNSKKLASLLRNAKSTAEENPQRKADIQSCTSAIALQYLLKDKAAKDELFFKICSEDESIDEAIAASTYPRLVASGELGDFSQFLIAADCKILTKLKVEIPMAIAMLVGVFYVFNIEYTPGVRGVFAFLEAATLGRHQLAKNRIAVQKLIKEVGACK